jgi:DNA repair protein RecN (Recombination protein N)
MLRSLHLTDFVLVTEAEIDFSAGFSALTGETGAGKSILIDALGLVLGGRGDAGVIREGASKTSIAAEFDVDANVATFLAEHELDASESVLLRRVIDREGRSKAFINGAAVPVTQLRALGDLLVDIHGQHAHQLLQKPAAQRSLLDGFGKLEAPVAEVAERWKTLREARALLTRAQTEQASLDAERERLAWQLDELDRLAPQAGEWTEVESEHRRLSHAAGLIETASSALNALEESDEPLIGRLDSLHGRLAAQLAHDARLQGAVDALEAAAIQAREAAHALSHYLNSSDLDPQRLEEIEQRLSALHGTARKLRVDPAVLADHWQAARDKMGALDAASNLPALQAAVDAAQKAFDTAARKLSTERAKAARKLAAAATEAMQTLAMQGGRLEIALTPDEAGPTGTDAVEFLVAGHAGATPRALGKVASGGELSRISLAIAVIASTANATPTLIFDEVDAGVGGAVAEVVGRLMRQLGADRQVLAVTHLPQVAARAHQQFKVEKFTVAGSTQSAIRSLGAADRVDEIARMLAGETITATSKKHAKELLAAD